MPGFPSHDSGLAWHAATGDVIAFGGVDADANGDVRTSDATWSWSGGAWRRLDPAVTPPARRHPLLVGDGTGDVLLFGGSAWPASSPGRTGRVTHHADAWRWDGRTWAALGWREPVSGVLAYDRSRRRPVLVGGVGPALNIRTPRATWVWTGDRWSVLTSSVPADSLLSLTDDPRTGELIGFAGADRLIPRRTRPASGRPGRLGFARTWVLADGRWRAEPFPEAGFGLVVTDPATGDVLAVTTRGSTWRRAPGRWERLSDIEHSPGVRWAASRTGSGVLLVLTGPAGSGETWSREGADWHLAQRCAPGSGAHR
jgi:hypothetical protein